MMTIATPVSAGAVGLLLAAGVLLSLWRLALVDAREFVIDPSGLAALVACGAAWHMTAVGEAAVGGFRPAWWPIAGALAGALVAGGGEAVRAALLRSRPGRQARFGMGLRLWDVWLLAAVGFLLGPFALLHAVLLGAGLCLLWRVWWRRRRRRPVGRGYAALAPGMIAGAAVVFVSFHSGVSFAKAEETSLVFSKEIEMAAGGTAAGGIAVRARFAGSLGDALAPVELEGILEAARPLDPSARERFRARVLWHAVTRPGGAAAPLPSHLESRFRMLRSSVREGTGVKVRGDVASAIAAARGLRDVAARAAPAPKAKRTASGEARARPVPEQPRTQLAFAEGVELGDRPPPGGVRVRATFLGADRRGLAPVRMAGVLHAAADDDVAVRWDSVSLVGPYGGEEWLARPLVSRLGDAAGGIPNGRPVAAEGDVDGVLAAARRLMAAALEKLPRAVAGEAAAAEAVAGGLVPDRLGALSATVTTGPATVPLRVAQARAAASAALRETRGDLPARETGLAPGPDVPAEVADREVAVSIEEALPWPQMVERIARETGLSVRLEERPGRVVGAAAELADPAPAAFLFEGTVRELLDSLASRSGYAWEWEGEGAVFYRYWDRAQAPPPPAPDIWKADAARHETLSGVLRDWASRAGWSVEWAASEDFELGVSATFQGPFLRVVDDLLKGEETRRAFLVRAFEPNRQLVIEDAGRSVQ